MVACTTPVCSEVRLPGRLLIITRRCSFNANQCDFSISNRFNFMLQRPLVTTSSTSDSLQHRAQQTQTATTQLLEITWRNDKNKITAYVVYGADDHIRVESKQAKAFGW